jgi:hypothetical protein
VEEAWAVAEMVENVSVNRNRHVASIFSADVGETNICGRVKARLCVLSGLRVN